MAITILVTGFGPFPGAPQNPSGPLALRVARRRRPAFANVTLVPHVFPTSYQAIEREFPALIARHRPDAVLMFGLASRTRHLRVETRAHNGISSIFPDAARRRPTAARLAPKALAWLPARAPCATLLHAARATGVAAALSHDAGRYLCNALYWRALEASAQNGGPRVAAFVHVPRADVLSSAALARAGEALLRAILAAARRPR
jgi:pyroglutamyl-peptidase